MDKLNLLKECEGAKTIGIGGHIRPDGDCVGSCLALWMYLTKACPEAVTEVFIEQPADVFGCIRGVDQIRSDFPEREPFDVFFALDCVPDRMGGAEQYFHAAKKTINIDHHISNANMMIKNNCAFKLSETLYNVKYLYESFRALLDNNKYQHNIDDLASNLDLGGTNKIIETINEQVN